MPPHPDTTLTTAFDPAPLLARARATAPRLTPLVRRTPAVPSATLSARIDGDAYLKLESLQATGSFKLRGAFAKLLALDPRPAAVVAASTGNHGAAVAHAARALGIAARVFVPRSAQRAKLAAIEALGAELVAAGEDCLEAEAAARDEAARTGAPYVSPYNDLDVVAGQASVGLELGEDLPPCDLVSVAVGGGGLIAGVATVLKDVWPAARIVGASPERSAVMARSLELGRVVEDDGLPTLSDGTAGGLEAGSVTIAPCAALVDEWILVPEEEIAAEMHRALLEEHLVIEGAAAVAVAGLLRAARTRPARRAVAVVCGGNVSADTLRRVLFAAGPAGGPRPG